MPAPAAARAPPRDTGLLLQCSALQSPHAPPPPPLSPFVRRPAAGRGAVFAIRELFKALGMGPIAGKSFVIQGFGNVGSWAAQILHEHGGRVVAVADAFSGLANERGLDVPSLRQHLADAHSLASFPDGAAIPKDSILTVPCDVLIPAAIGGVLTEATAAEVQCRVVVEAANGPTTFAGDQELRRRGIVVLPDIYTNAGGVTVSFFEWVQNLQVRPWGGGWAGVGRGAAGWMVRPGGGTASQHRLQCCCLGAASSTRNAWAGRLVPGAWCRPLSARWRGRLALRRRTSSGPRRR